VTSLAIPSIRRGWQVVVADPPWSFRDKGSRIAPDWEGARLPRLRAVAGYPTMDLDAIKALPVSKLVARDAFLFLWTTSTHLLDGSAAAVARAWGFEPKTTIVWCKVRNGYAQIGMGHYTRGAHELVVLGRRGSARFERHDLSSVIFSPRGLHSAKPIQLQRLAEAAVPKMRRRLELFARRERHGWVTWGDQLQREADCA
jgi:N6-adenosine-specific RNA methylase IME4